MKAQYYFIAIAVGLFAWGCNKIDSDNKTANNTEKVTIRATISDETADDSKVVLNISTLDLQWAADEVIQLMCPGVSMTEVANIYKKYPFTLDSKSGDGKTAVFTGSLVVPDEYKFAAFVGGANGSRETKTQFGWYFTNYSGLRYPHLQEYVAGGPKSEYLYMVADPTTNASIHNLTFRHKVSIIHIPVKSTGASVSLKSIQIKCENGGRAISGCYYGGMNKTSDTAPNYGWGNDLAANVPISANEYGSGKKAILDGGEYGNTVTLQKDGGTGIIGTALSGTAQDFYFVTAPGSHGILTITLTDNSSDSKVISTKNGITTSAGKVYHFPELDWGAL